MSTDTAQSRVTVDEVAQRCRAEMIPITSKFSYFSTMPIPEEDLRQYLRDPIAAISPSLAAELQKIGSILAPFLEKGNGKHAGAIVFERPVESRSIPTAITRAGGGTTLVFAVRDVEVADYHYQFYGTLAGLVAGSLAADVQEGFYRVLREELSAEMHGEVDERSWHLKQALLRRQKNVRSETKLFR